MQEKEKVIFKYGFEQSDHASVLVEMYINEEIKVGPGLTRVNSVLLDDPVKLTAVIADLNVMMEQKKKKKKMFPENLNLFDLGQACRTLCSNDNWS